MLNQLRVTYGEREVNNPALKILLFFWAGVVFTAGATLFVVVVILLIALSPVLVPSHILLRKAGRKGFITETSTGDTINFKISPEAFRKE